MPVRSHLVRSRPVRSALAWFVGWIALASAPDAQRIIHEWQGVYQPPNGDMYGYSVAALGDVDGDGVVDVAVGAPRTIVGGVEWAGRAYVYSGRTGSLILQLSGSAARRGVGSDLEATGDVDRDGRADLLDGTSDLIATNYHTVWALPHAAPIHVFVDYGNFAAGPGDVDGDGYPDIMLSGREPPGAPLGAGRVDVLSGKDGSLIYRYVGTFRDQALGPVERAGDLDGDGRPDILVEAPGAPHFGTGPSGIWAYSGRSGGLLFHLPALSPTWGRSFRGVGDLDADGYDDVAVVDEGVPNHPDNARVDVFAGPSGQKLFAIDLPKGPYFVDRIGDLDGDGHDDFSIVGGPVASARAVSGRDWSTLLAMTRTGLAWLGGDLDGDDFPDLIGGGSKGPLLNVIRIWSGAPDGVTTLGLGCPARNGTIPRIGAGPLPPVSNRVSIHLSRVPTGAPAGLVLGTSSTSWNGLPLPLDLTFLGMPGCLLRVAPDHVHCTTTQGIPSRGHATFEAIVPNESAVRGTSLFAQWLVLTDPGTEPAFAVTRALELRVP